jgi:hypothetical protein
LRHPDCCQQLIAPNTAHVAAQLSRLSRLVRDGAPVVELLAVIAAKIRRKNIVGRLPKHSVDNTESQDRIGPSCDSDDRPRRRTGAQEFIVDDYGKIGRRIDLDEPMR